MGAAASIELQKPTDASDISSTQSLDVARGEVCRLRELLGQYAKDAGFSEVVYDASDLVHGYDEVDDFNRCIDEIVHIRTALRMSTQKSRRQTRGQITGMDAECRYQKFRAESSASYGSSDESDDN
mmetsp:Transcript_21469/g.31138  ORF Transcript_21469/g.31138 Transcript_21469/m.31138 type:complete len:126 (-) Transcript_21469:117-494(-)|eukprot:CAMPEP_0185018300 /NCGR_PEP_ID=MMETSP1103-20130426/1071_1 /TAXON_ID=36769 /ORGANISM="Paraphysomonas bandaiensis, Strain Caron Lab Isolate" /LENGTH=125 /DNA_ID=CAMNT_0027548061 /DNA_START=105 /DNA_END=482 /DNA_ORIENTATION=+